MREAETTEALFSLPGTLRARFLEQQKVPLQEKLYDYLKTTTTKKQPSGFSDEAGIILRKLYLKLLDGEPKEAVIAAAISAKVAVDKMHETHNLYGRK